jgi:hypothetical protein
MMYYPIFADRLTGPDMPSRVALMRWPGGRPFALFLSHDVGQIDDGGLFAGLAGGNGIHRLFAGRQPAPGRLVCRQAARPFFNAKPSRRDFEALIALEGGHGFRSTCFLHPQFHLARRGGRHALNGELIQFVTRMIQDAGGELGVHGGYHHSNSAARYRASIEAIESNFGVRPCGIRNHLPSFSYPGTWRAQAEAGFAYDASYGLAGELGPRGGWPFPFQTCDATAGRLLDLYELPITVMDVTLFHHLELGGEAALGKAWEVVRGVIGAGGLVSLLWHNNHFNESEYRDRQRVYEELLLRLAPLKPWCATGEEINTWARARAAVRVEEAPGSSGNKQLHLTAGLPLHNPVIEIGSPRALVHHARARCRASDDRTRVEFDHWSAGETVTVEIPD